MRSNRSGPQDVTEGNVVRVPPSDSQPPQAPSHHLWPRSEEDPEEGLDPTLKRSIRLVPQQVAAMATALRPAETEVGAMFCL